MKDMRIILLITFNYLIMTTAITPILLQVTSAAFNENGFIPSKYSCEKESINPPISIKNIPANSKSLALVVDDPDAPNGTVVHWVMWNIDPATTMINENSAPGIQGKNQKGMNGYMGPCPPFGIHHYHFKIYALDTKLTLSDSAGKQGLEDAMKNHIVARGELIGLYKKS
jgi:Raf kinase inhibitor-like YbhB/YbcL family protein